MKKFRAEFYSSESGESVFSCFCLETVDWDLAWAIAKLIASTSKYDTVVVVEFEEYDQEGNLVRQWQEEVVEDTDEEVKGLRRIKRCAEDIQARAHLNADPVTYDLMRTVLDSEFDEGENT